MNLSEIVIREDDTFKTLLEKAEIASIIGTIQSSYTHFPYLRKIWKKNTEEEALLGVSMTGIMDNVLTSTNNDELKEMLQQIKQHVIEVNVYWADILGINPSTATTAVKPSGTVSQLVNSSSGIHTRYSPYYIRTVRNDNKDPITEFLKVNNVPNEPCAMKPDTTTIFSFPMKSPENSLSTKDLNAIEQLEIWLTYQRHWCEHKPSVTISVREHEWMEVGAFVYKHFDEISGVSFLPYSEHSYQQAPYQEITKDQYEEQFKITPTTVDWTKMVEDQDVTTSSQELACTAGGCEV